ncbi:MAG: serine hydrolase [Blastocatellia bacterium]|nr:serine hydrolase [Blastocatellia bacterium]
MNVHRSFTPKILVFVVSLFIQSLVLAQQPAGYRYTPPEKLNDGIRTGTLKDAGLDEAKIVAGTNEILNGTYPNIHSLIIIRNGRLVFEKYFTGEDFHRGKGRLGVVEHSRDTLHDMRSVTKSIVGLAVIHAFAKRKIKSLDQPIFEFFPGHVKHAEGEKKGITVRHLLTMSPGLEWNESLPYTDPANSETAMDRSTDPSEFVLSQKLLARPGSKFDYNGGATHLLAEIIRKATGLAADEYASRNLFAPLGITKFEWVKGKNGYLIAASGLRLRSRDLAKIGMLLMNKGKWDRKRIIPAKLVEEAMEEHVKLADDTRPEDLEGYGYQIWRLSTLIHGDRADRVEFSGNGGQKVQIDAANKLMVVVTAGNYNKRGLKKSSMHIYEDIVYPALLDRKPAQINRAKAAKP